MPLLPQDCLEQAAAEVLKRWQQPSPNFASGADFRTTENALLILFYRQLLKASEFGWLNAGRSLIDKTYIQILWHLEGLQSMSAVPAQDIAAQLDNFIRTELASRWPLPNPGAPRVEPADSEQLVQMAARNLFGCFNSEVAASRLLFYLCPMLPVYSYSRGHQQTLQQLGYSPANDYSSYAEACRQAYQQDAQSLRTLPRPHELGGNHKDQHDVQWLFGTTDWWPRRIWLEALKRYGRQSLGIEAAAFGCDDEGR